VNLTDTIQPYTRFKLNEAVPSWNYHERLAKGKGIVTEWIISTRMDKKTQANLDRTLEQLRQQPQTNWSRPNASSLGDHIYVIRFKSSKGGQLRIFGHFHLLHDTFAMTLHGYEKDRKYHPPDYQARAKEYKACCDSDFSTQTRKYRDMCDICTKRESI
jgi:hypothetical protein